MTGSLRRASLALWAAAGLCPMVRGGTPDPANVLIVIADDLGVEMVQAYGVGPSPPATPTLDALAAGGVLFRNAYSQPKCSPTRASMLTGRHPSRHGIGALVGEADLVALSLDEVTLPELLDLGTGGAYAHAAFGKWHLGSDLVGGNLAPNLAGFGHFDGTTCSLSHQPSKGYFDWHQVVDGAGTQVTTYNTTAIVDSAIAWLDATPEPWLCWVAFNAPHAPFHAPPDELHAVDLSQAGPPEEDPRPHYAAAIEALDTELGRLLASLDTEVRERTSVVFVGDNGTPATVIGEPYAGNQGKGTLAQGGVHVPMIVDGPLVGAPGGESEALVHVLDVYATVAELAGLDTGALLPGVELDAQSLVPYLTDPATPSARATVFAESFAPNTPGGPTLPDPWCQFDLGMGGPGTVTLQACGPPLFEQGVSTLEVSGAPPAAPGFLVFALQSGAVGVLGGTLVPFPIDLTTPVVTSPAGSLALSVPGSWAPEAYPMQIHAQAVVQDEALPKGWAFSNAIVLQFLPPADAKRMLRDERYKLIRIVVDEPAGPVVTERFHDLLLDPYEETDLLEADGVRGLTAEQLAAYEALSAELLTWF